MEVQSSSSASFHKQSLYAVLKEKVPKEETFQTLFVEFLVKSRPPDSESIISNHILLGKNTVMSLGRFHADEEYLRRQWRIAQYWTDEF
jgi:hypothetical protein